MRKILCAFLMALITTTANSQVQETWVQNYTTSNTDHGEEVIDMEVDPSGNVFILGENVNGTLMIKYDRDGNTIWIKPITYIDGIAMAIDAPGNIYVTGVSSSHYLTVKFDPSGTQLWQTPYFAEDEDGRPSDIAVDLNGNVYVTGESSTGHLSDEELCDYATVKYNAFGSQMWARRFNGADPGAGYDAATSLTLDAIGNIYVTGSSQKDGDIGIGTVKYSPSGTVLWVQHYQGPNGEEERANEIKLDAAGNVFVSGLSRKLLAGGIVDYDVPVVVKYTFSGFELWARRPFEEISGSYHQVQQILVDASGNSILTGHSFAFPFFIKYNAAGDYVWGRVLPSIYSHNASAITDGSNIYYVSTTQSGIVTLKLNASGTELWRKEYEGIGVMGLIGIDALQNIFVSNTWRNEASGRSDIVTIRYSQCTIVCPANITVNNDAGQCGAVVTFADVTTTGDCGSTFTYSHSSGATFPVGTTTVTVSSDATGASCSFTITVVDNENPVITNCPSGKTVNTSPGVCYATAASVAGGTATATDNCSVTVAGVRSDGLALSANYPVGNTTIKWTATDASNNTTTCSQTITVVDNVPPTITGESASVVILSPSNHTMRDVTINYTATDGNNCGVTSVIVVTSNEPINGVGDGDTDPDWIDIDNHHVKLRAERSANGTGRIYTITITATDGYGNTAAKTVEVRVPHNIKNPHSGQAFKVGSTVSFEGEFWDKAGNSHSAKWLIDENTTVKATVTEPSGNKNGKITGSYKFTAPGVYKLQMNVTDQKGITHYSNTAGDLEAIVVIYDPNGGYAYGGGYYNSPAGALRSDPSATGKASYGFTLNYFKNSTYPKGETQFEFKVGSFEFNALNFEYLVINNSMSQFKGTGKIIGGQSGVGFTMTVTDGQLDGSGVDKIRMKIYNKNNGSIIYDNQPGASDAALPTQAVGTNSIIVISGTNSSLTQSNTTQKAEMEATAPEVSGGLDVIAYPNPSATNFSVSVKTNSVREKITMQVIDMYGRIIETRNVNANSPVRFGDRYNPGTYFVRILQGKEHKEIKLVKLSD